MSTHKVVMEIEIEASNPLEAALAVREIMKDNSVELQYYVQSEDGLMYSVDLAEESKDAVLSIMFYDPLIVPNENSK